MSSATTSAALRGEVLSAGLLTDLGEPGVFGRSAAFESLCTGLIRLVRAAAGPGVERATFPPVEPRVAFAQTGYLESFPDLLGSVHTFRGTDKDHVALQRAHHNGEDWTAGLTPTGVVMTPAICHPLYATLTGTLPAQGRTFDLVGWAFRAEPSQQLTRMQSFRMHEIVFAGDVDAALAHREKWLEIGQRLLSDLGLPVECVIANDPFFGRLGKLMANSQKADALKYELVVEVDDPDRPTAIMSANYHRDHFGEPFGIKTADGSVAHSACIGFGLERVALALIRWHGTDPAGWPEALRPLPTD